MKTFTVTHTEKVEASKETVWRLWSDVNTWPNWDEGLISCKAEGEFKVGGSFELMPKGAPQAVKATLQNVVENESFSDKTDLGFATIEAHHKLEEIDSVLWLTHTIIAKVDDEKAEFYAENIWPGFETGLPQSVKNLVELAIEQEKSLVRSKMLST